MTNQKRMSQRGRATTSEEAVVCHSRAGGNPVDRRHTCLLDSSLRGNDESDLPCSQNAVWEQDWSENPRRKKSCESLAARSPRRSSRHLTLLAAVCFLTTLPGCALKEWFVRKTAPPPRVLMSDATPQQILEHLNNERARLVSWRSTDVRIKVRGEGVVAPSLSANISVESPRNLRFSARSLRGTEVDFGSNTDRFWFWMRASQPDIILTGSHEGLNQQQAMPIPFPPSWLMESLGVIPIDPSSVQVLREPETPDQARLVSTEFVQGQQVQRIMLVDLALGQIVEHALYDANNQLIANAVMEDFRQTPNGVTLPHRITLDCASAGTEMTMTVGQIEVNPQIPTATWQMQMDPSLQVVDLDRAYSGLPQRQ